jgi:nucleoside-diphosphate-sugar epimerase
MSLGNGREAGQLRIVRGPASGYAASMRSERNSGDPARLLVVGAGFMGGHLAESLRQEPIPEVAPESIVLTTRSEEHAARLVAQGWLARAFDLSSDDPLDDLVAGVRFVVYCAAPSGASSRTEVYAEGPARLAAALPTGAHLVLASSTGVYAEADGGVVDEEAAPSDRDGATVQLAGEAAVLAVSGTVLRFSGLAGPERGPHRRDLPSGVQLDRWLNLVWIEDVVASLRWTLQAQANGVFNVSGPPQRRRQFYDDCQRLRGLGPLSWAKDEREGYRVDSSRWQRASGLTPRAVTASLVLDAN